MNQSQPPLLAPSGESPAAELQRLREDLASELQRADLGELARPMAHEVNNLLNNLMLNLMILEQGGGDTSLVSLTKMRHQAEQLTALIKEFQDYRRPGQPAAVTVDVGQSVREAVLRLGEEQPDLLGPPGTAGRVSVTLDIHPDLPPIRAIRTDLARLLRFLLINAARAARSVKAGLRVSVARSAAGVALGVHVGGLEVPPESPAKLFDALAAKAPAMSGLELATCKSIARRFGGKFQASAEPGGVTILLEVASLSP